MSTYDVLWIGIRKCPEGHFCFNGGKCAGDKCTCIPLPNGETPSGDYCGKIQNYSKAILIVLKDWNFYHTGTINCGNHTCKNGGQCKNGECYCYPEYFGPTCREI